MFHVEKIHYKQPDGKLNKSLLSIPHPESRINAKNISALKGKENTVDLYRVTPATRNSYISTNSTLLL